MQFHTGHVLGATAVLAPTVAIFAPQGFPILLGVTALATLILRRVQDNVWPSPPKVVFVVFLLLLAWSLIGVAWSIDVRVTLEKLLRVLGISVAGLIVLDAALGLEPQKLRAARTLLLAGFLIGLVLLTGERVMHAPIVTVLHPDIANETTLWIIFNRGTTVLVLFVWPTVLVLGRRNRTVAVLVWISTLGVIYTYPSDAAILALIAGGGICVLTWFAPRIMQVVLAALSAMFILTSPMVLGKMVDLEAIKSERRLISDSGYHRLLIWNFTAERIFERPFGGWGLDTSRSIPGGRKRLDFTGEELPLHPHNSALQIWLELGLPGALLATVLVGWILITIGRGVQGAAEKAAMMGMCVTALGISFLSYGVWQSWWLSALWLAAAFAAMCWKNDAVTASG